MTATNARRRGEPLLALALVVFGWVGGRIALWEDLGVAPTRDPVSLWDNRAQNRAHNWAVGADSLPRPGPEKPRVLLSPPDLLAFQPRPTAGDAIARPLEPPLLNPVSSPPLPRVAISPHLAGGHALLWLAAVSRLPGPEALIAPAGANAAGRVTAGALAPRSSAAQERRWSADGWTLLRSGGGAPAIGIGGTYGASQAGAVLRYRLAPISAHKPTAYLRVTAALSGSGEREAAAGLSLRPLPAVPVIVAGEGRVGRFGSATLVRPAVMAVTEIAPIDLPAGLRAEFYAQTGYVGGRGATAFADGQLRMDRRVGKLGGLELRAGAGAWGGAQKGAERLDLGPSATLGMAKGSAAARVAIDWRFRVAGTAAPISGPAVTVSAGF